MEKTVAFAPCHLTGIFQAFDKKADPLSTGSRGAGVSLNKGVKTTVTIQKSPKSSSQIRINGVVSDYCQVSRRVLNMFFSRLNEVQPLGTVVEHDIETPIGAGFGVSGAAALSLALSLNEALELGMSKTEAAQLAHVAEVECKTGLGTVIAETYGGLEVRVQPGAPGVGEVKNIPVPEYILVACASFAPLSTRKLLNDEETRQRVNDVGGKLVDKLIEEPDYLNFMRLSRQFAEHVGLMTARMRKVLKETDGADFVCSMSMFGETLFTLVERKNLERLLKIFNKYLPKEKTVVSEINIGGARLLP